MRKMRWNNLGDRRRGQRVESNGTALVHIAGECLAGRVLDLAIGGIALRLGPGIDVTAHVGATVRLDLRLDGQRTHWMHAGGAIARFDPERRRLNVRFTYVPPELEDLIQDEAVGALEHEVSPCVMIVDRLRARRSTMGDVLRHAGCRVVETSSPLEALHRLDESTLHPDLIAIADTEPRGDGEQLRGFVHRAYPGVKVVAVAVHG